MLLLVLKILHLLSTHDQMLLFSLTTIPCVAGVKRLYNYALFWMAINFFASFAICLSVSIALLHIHMQRKDAYARFEPKRVALYSFGDSYIA